MTKTPYTTIEKVQAYLLQDISESFQANVERWILGISRTMDQMANRQLVADTYESEESLELRYFDVEKLGYITIDDCVEIESIEYKNGDDWEELDASEYDLYPAIAPHRKIIYAFTPGLQAVRVRARWGYMEDITEDLQWAATVLVAGVCTANQAITGRNPGAVVKEKIGTYEVQYTPGIDNDGKVASFRDLEEAKEIIAGYKKILL